MHTLIVIVLFSMSASKYITTTFHEHYAYTLYNESQAYHSKVINIIAYCLIFEVKQQLSRLTGGIVTHRLRNLNYGGTRVYKVLTNFNTFFIEN